jgi:hypothetical protein
MTVQLVILKSGEEIISDVREIIDKDTEKQMSLVFINPYLVSVNATETLYLTEEKTEPYASVSFTPWIPLSKSKQYFVPHEWVVTICEPHDDILNSYLQKFGEENDSQGDSIEDEQSVSDIGD